MPPEHHEGHTPAPAISKCGECSRDPSPLERAGMLHGAFDIQAPNPPSLRGAQCFQLQKRRTSTHTARDIHTAIPEIYILMALRNRANPRRFLAPRLFSGTHLPCIRNILGPGSHFHR